MSVSVPPQEQLGSYRGMIQTRSFDEHWEESATKVMSPEFQDLQTTACD